MGSIADKKDTVIREYLSGDSINLIAHRHAVTNNTVRDNLIKWGVDLSLTVNPMRRIPAPERYHSNEIVFINGKPMRDVTDYIVDCGGVTPWRK